MYLGRAGRCKNGEQTRWKAGPRHTEEVPLQKPQDAQREAPQQRAYFCRIEYSAPWEYQETTYVARVSTARWQK